MSCVARGENLSMWGGKKCSKRSDKVHGQMSLQKSTSNQNNNNTNGIILQQHTVCVVFFPLHILWVKIDHLEENKTNHSAVQMRIFAATPLRLLPGAPMETAVAMVTPCSHSLFLVLCFWCVAAVQDRCVQMNVLRQLRLSHTSTDMRSVLASCLLPTREAVELHLERSGRFWWVALLKQWSCERGGETD